MMISPEGFISKHRKDSYEKLLALREELIADIHRFERKKISEDEWMIHPFPEVVYQCNLQYLARLCDYIAERYNREFVWGEEEHWLFTLRDYLQDRGLTYGTSLPEEIRKRKEGKQYSIQDHIRVMIYSMLTNQTKWHRVEPHLSEIDKLFFEYDPDELLKTEPEYFSNGLFAIKCGNMSNSAQMKALSDNIRTLQRIEEENGSIDAFVTADSADAIVQKLSKGRSPYKLKMLGEALVWEYLRNVGIDGAKPDTHLRRFLGADRMGTGDNSPATMNEVNDQVGELSEETGLSKAEVDNLIWSFCADGFGEICTATPRCGDCPIREHCNADRGRS